MKVKGEKKWGFCLFVIVLAAALLRLVFFHLFLSNNPCLLLYDARHYHTMASDLLRCGHFCDNSGNYYFYRLPVYPLFLAASYWLGSINIALSLQVILSLLIPVLCFFIAREIGLGLFVGLLSAVVVALHPGFLIFSGLVMTETFFTVFFLLFVLLFLFGSGWRLKKSMGILFFSGVCLGIVSLTRPVGLPLLMSAMIVVFIIDRDRLIKKLATCLTLMSGWLSIVGVWLVRNYLLTGYIFLHTLSGNHCINHGAVPVVMKARLCTYVQARDYVENCLRAQYLLATKLKNGCLSEVEESNIAECCAVEILKEYPCTLFKHCVVNVGKTLFGLYTSELLVIDSGGQLPPYDNNRSFKDMLVRFLCPSVHNCYIIPVIYFEMALHLFILLGTVLFCLWSFWHPAWRSIVFLFIPFIGLFVGLSCLCGFARLRLPIECFLIMVAVTFWRYTFSKKR